MEFPDDPQWRPGRHGLYQYYHNHHRHVILILLFIISNHDDEDHPPPLPHHVNDDHVGVRRIYLQVYPPDFCHHHHHVEIDDFIVYENHCDGNIER